MSYLQITPGQIWTNYTTHNCRKWLGWWVQYNPTTREVIKSFDSIRHIQLVDDSTMRHQNTFIYEDGSSVNEGRMNGPWEYLKDRDCDERGLIHPSSRKIGNDARAFFLANGGGAWTIMEVKQNKVFFLEIFFPDQYKRFSTGINYDAEGKAARISLIREDNRTTPSVYWSKGNDFRNKIEPEGKFVGSQITLTSGLQQSTETGCQWNRNYWLKEKRAQEEGNTVLYLPDNIMASFPVEIDPGHSFHVSIFCHYTEGDQNEIRQETIYFEHGNFAYFKQGIYFPEQE